MVVGKRLVPEENGESRLRMWWVNRGGVGLLFISATKYMLDISFVIN